MTAEQTSSKDSPAPEQKSAIDLKDVDFQDPHINDLASSGLKAFYTANYDSATEKFGEACQTYSANNEGNEDPILLYYYGRALYKVAVSNNDVLGAERAAAAQQQQQQAEEAAESETGNEQGEKKDKKGFFQFSGSYGDIPEEDSQDGQDEVDPEGDATQPEDYEQEEEGEEQSDFEIAWELLDLARTLFIKNISQAKENGQTDEDIKKLETLLADTYDLLGDVSLESENFTEAVQDLESALELKLKIYDKVSTAISEAHFRLSLAHELDTGNPNHIDRAINELEQTIKCVEEIGFQQEEKGEKKDTSLVKDLSIKLHELKQTKAADNEEKVRVIEGILGAQARISGGPQIPRANDISGLVRKRKAPKEEEATSSKK